MVKPEWPGVAVSIGDLREAVWDRTNVIAGDYSSGHGRIMTATNGYVFDVIWRMFNHVESALSVANREGVKS